MKVRAYECWLLHNSLVPWIDSSCRLFLLLHWKEWNEALECYHTAISLNPQNGLALQGIVRLEKLLKGIDPDNDEEEEMGEEGGVHDEDVW